MLLLKSKLPKSETGSVKMKIKSRRKYVPKIKISSVIVIAAAIAFVAVLKCFNFSDDISAQQTAASATAFRAASEYLAPPLKSQKTEDPLLVLVNADNPIPDDWQVLPRFIGDEAVDIRIYEDLNSLLIAAQEDEVVFWIASGYRSVEQQTEILNRAVQDNIDIGMSEEEAEKKALRTIAKPRHSEHHTGLAVDFNDVSDDFEETEAYYWLCENAADYGFVQRYKRDKVEITGIDNESWHYRYVGKEHATEMERLNMCLEEYVEYVKNINQ